MAGLIPLGSCFRCGRAEPVPFSIEKFAGVGEDVGADDANINLR